MKKQLKVRKSFLKKLGSGLSFGFVIFLIIGFLVYGFIGYLLVCDAFVEIDANDPCRGERTKHLIVMLVSAILLIFIFITALIDSIRAIKKRKQK